MTSALQRKASTLTSDNAWLAGAYDLEDVDLTTTDYTPAVPARGFYILGVTGTVKVITLAGTTYQIPSGLATGIAHPIPFTKMFKTGTAATTIVAIG